MTLGQRDTHTDRPVVDVARDAQFCVHMHPQLVCKKIAAYTPAINTFNRCSLLAQCDIGCIIEKEF